MEVVLPQYNLPYSELVEQLRVDGWWHLREGSVELTKLVGVLEFMEVHGHKYVVVLHHSKESLLEHEVCPEERRRAPLPVEVLENGIIILVAK